MLADKAGVSLGTVGNAENGSTIPQPGRLNMMLEALDDGERLAALAPPLLAEEDRREMEEWLHGTVSVHAKSGRTDIADRLADVHDSLRGTIDVAWTLLDLGVDIDVVRRLVDEATEAFIASGAYVALSTAGIDKADEFVSKSGELLAEVKRRREAGELGQPSFISKMAARARREGYRAGMQEAIRKASGGPAQPRPLYAFDEEDEAARDEDRETPRLGED